jgi:hypothetical protein
MANASGDEDDVPPSVDLYAVLGALAGPRGVAPSPAASFVFSGHPPAISPPRPGLLASPPSPHPRPTLPSPRRSPRRRRARRELGGDQEGVPRAGPEAPPRQEPRRRSRGRARPQRQVPGDLRLVRDPLGREEAQVLRRDGGRGGRGRERGGLREAVPGDDGRDARRRLDRGRVRGSRRGRPAEHAAVPVPGGALPAGHVPARRRLQRRLPRAPGGPGAPGERWAGRPRRAPGGRGRRPRRRTARWPPPRIRIRGDENENETPRARDPGTFRLRRRLRLVLRLERRRVGVRVRRGP